MTEADKILCALTDLDDREVDAINAKVLHGMKIGGVTSKTDRKRKRRYVELRLIRALPLHESEAA